MYRESRLRRSGRGRKEVFQSLDGIQVISSRSDIPRGYPARPTSDAICGYIGDLGPFYTKTVLELRRNSNLEVFLELPTSDNNGETSETVRTNRGFLARQDHWLHSRRRVRFADTVEEAYIQRRWEREGEVFSWSPLASGARRFYSSVWIGVSLGALLLSTLLLMTSFVTSSWGVMIIPMTSENFKSDQIARGGRTWIFGLWQCCRDDGLCLGLKWPAFYTATRVFAILSLFGHALTFAWMLGHTLEKLLNYDSCTMLTLIANCFVTSSFSLISVVCFGAIWPEEFSRLFPTAALHLGYSYFLAVVTIPLTIISGACALIDFKGAWKVYEIQEQFGTDEEEDVSEEEEEEGDEEAQEPINNRAEGDICTHQFTSV